MTRFRLRATPPHGRRAGHEVAWVQLPVTLPAVSAQPPRAGGWPGRLEVEETGERIVVAGADFEVVFSRAEGRMQRLVWRNHVLLEAGPRLQVWRAPTDNDGIKGMPRPGAQAVFRPLARRRPRRPGLPPAVGLGRADGGPGGGDHPRRTAGCAAADAALAHRHIYRIAPDGRIRVESQFHVDAAVADLPRLGVTLTAPSGFEAVERGSAASAPSDTYSDRNRAGWVGRFEGTVSGSLRALCRAAGAWQSNTDLRWLALRGDGAGVRFTPARPCEGSVSHFTPEDLTASHPRPPADARAPRCWSASMSASAASAPPAAGRTRWSVIGLAPATTN